MATYALHETGVRADADDGTAFAVAFDAHARSLVRLAYLLCGDERRAEDAVAEAFAKVWPKWRGGHVDDLLPYLRRAVVNQVNGGFRRRVLERREAARQWGDLRGQRAVDDAAADAQAVAAALRRLPEGQRTAIVLRYYQDLTEVQTAEVLGINVGTVKSQVSRGLDKLRALLAEEE